ncbi:Zinc finger, GRF-type [Sesbania bispinosa]|nr:Zinc finger, GRF-type [Sesbania bispinosa]
MGGETKIPQCRTQKRSFNGSSSTSNASMGNNVRFCHCGRKATVKTSKTQRNLGRAFYTCALPKDDSLNCNYFCWIDDVVEESAECERDMDAWLKNQLIMKIEGE